MSKDIPSRFLPVDMPLYNRRQALPIIFFGAAVIANEARKAWRGNVQPVTENETPTVEQYRNGETIDHPFKPRVNGWGVELDMDTMFGEVAQNVGTDYEISLRTYSESTFVQEAEPQIVRLTISNQPNDIVRLIPDIFDFPRDAGEGVDNQSIARIQTDTRSAMSINMLPRDSESFGLLQIVAQKPGGIPTSNSFVFPLETLEHNNLSTMSSIHSEVDLSGDSMESLLQISELYDGLFSDKIFVVDSEKYSFGVNPFPEKGGIVLESDFIERPTYPQQAEIALTHAISAAIIKNFANVVGRSYGIPHEVTSAFHNTTTAYEAFVLNAQKSVPRLYHATRNTEYLSEYAKQSAFVRIFDDTYYTQQRYPYVKRPHYPYPRDGRLLDPDMLFASALTTFQFYPDEFLKNYARLTEEQQGLVRNFAAAAIGFMDAKRSENSPNLPDYAKIKTALQI